MENLFTNTVCESHYDDVTVTSVINIKYGDVTVESIPQGKAFCHSFSLGERTQPFTQKMLAIILLLNQQYMFQAILLPVLM